MKGVKICGRFLLIGTQNVDAVFAFFIVSVCVFRIYVDFAEFFTLRENPTMTTTGSDLFEASIVYRKITYRYSTTTTSRRKLLQCVRGKYMFYAFTSFVLLYFFTFLCLLNR